MKSLNILLYLQAKPFVMTLQELREQFPILSRKIYGKPLVYFDNGATSQRPKAVLDKWSELTLGSNANIHRAVHCLAGEATDAYENARNIVRDFINAKGREEIIFTSGTTASINLVAFSFCETFVREGDEVIVGEGEHHSNIVPWQMACQRKGAVLKVLPLDDDGYLMIDKLDSLITEKTKILAVNHVSNVLGIVNPVATLAQICHSRGVKILVDGAQGIVHQRVDVQNMDCDFYAFSGHKMYAATGTGVLYGKKELLEQMVPYMGGGEMIATVRFSGTTYAPLPGKFEAGTQNFNSAPTFIPAIEFMRQLELDENINREMESVKEYLLTKLSENPKIHLFGIPKQMQDKIPVFSFVVEGVHHEDLALILDKMGIAVRSGQMCAEPLMDRYGVTGMLRVSLAPYNTMEEAVYFTDSLDKAIGMLI